MQYKIQDIVWPHSTNHQRCRKLFYRGDDGILDTDKLTLGFAQSIDLLTYLNACSWEKWQKYTYAQKLTFHLKICGKARITFLGAHKEALTVITTEFTQKEYDHEKSQEISYEFPENSEQMVGVKILALSPKLTISEGYFSVEIPESSLNPVKLALTTTTCHKEVFVKQNVELIRNEIINSQEDIAGNCFLHVVDNGRTLKASEINSKNIKLYPNINAGGSGGFARGMLEALNNPEFTTTHVLLMDDDILVLPESIKRTYNLLRLLKPEYQDFFISGAMLYYEDPGTQHEDIGLIDNNGMLKPVKEEFDHSLLTDNLQNEKLLTERASTYAAWWYCCIPRTQIEKHGLPLPIFIRIDDVEYSLRCNAHFITMSGICVWHMGFATKYNGVFDRYQHLRNLLIIQSTTGVIQDKDIIKLWYDAFRTEILQFNYSAAELILRALEDYLKGPEFLMKTSGEELLKHNREIDNTLRPISEIREGLDITMTPQEANASKPLSIQNQIYLKLTWNGQKLIPEKLARKGLAAVGYGGFGFQPETIARHHEVLAINPFNDTAVLYTRDRSKFKKLMKEYKRLTKLYQKHHQEVRQAYTAARDQFVSEEFWREYLQLS